MMKTTLKKPLALSAKAIPLLMISVGVPLTSLSQDSNRDLESEPLKFTATGDIDIRPSASSSAHDFDFYEGEWEITNHKRKKWLVGQDEWLDFKATGTMRIILHGMGNTDNFITTLDGKPFEGMTLRLFDPKTRLWSIYWADSNAGKLDVPVKGSFNGDIGTFYTFDTFEGKSVIMKFRWDKSDPDGPIWSQAFSIDKGKTWEWNWYMHFKRVGDKGPKTSAEH